MATATKNLNLRVDAELKSQAEQIFSELGLPTSTAITLFLKTVVRCKGIPFNLRLEQTEQTPNAETIKAMKEVDAGTNLVGPFHSMDAVMEELDA